ncbi:sortase [Corynebacterium macginleyi]|uniref:Class F sortase n=1 Tax=Corynebacterium macginleyi TaxID=38290 RepID=A0A3M0GZA0_9CORY|nr:class F sortase [Corynebacterium macginleyi]MBK4138944.1 sortase [Corynebacterium macginleyi]MBK4150288.1 sortase [Corynebacterium macginleyi]MBK4156872.1 sortase [Corynebacterium macginleyi]MBK4160405.1 sortase [Corynebacterium macginleyi]MBK4165494.1 sortase [Corynebacterium macginleyi]
MSEDTGREESPTRGKKFGFIALIAAVVLLLTLVVVGLTIGGGDKDGSDGSSADTSVGEGPDVKGDAYVDDSGAQEHEFEAAPGQFPGFGAMSLGIDGQYAAVDPVQAIGRGVFLPPHDVTRLGWYSASAVPGDGGNVGSSVITGHVNYQGQGTGYAEKFTRLQLNQEITVVIDGQERLFRVTEKPYRLAKGSDFPDVVNDTDGPNRLVLITCGGKFIGGALGYEDNIITVAEPVVPPAPPEALQV